MITTHSYPLLELFAKIEIFSLSYRNRILGKTELGRKCKMRFAAVFRLQEKDTYARSKVNLVKLIVLTHPLTPIYPNHQFSDELDCSFQFWEN